MGWTRPNTLAEAVPETDAKPMFFYEGEGRRGGG